MLEELERRSITSGESALGQLAHIRIGDRVTCPDHGMDLFPLFRVGRSPKPVEYTALAEGIAAGQAEVTEQESAAVPEMILWNRGPTMILVVNGEEIVGEYQNRIANATLLVAPGARLLMPVTCVEHGRWHGASPAFGVGEKSYHSLRQEKLDQVTESPRSTGRREVDQNAILARIAERQ